MGEFLGWLFMALFCITFGFYTGYSSSVVAKAAKDAIAECESTLPRNQTCKYVITAVPEVAE